MLIKKLFPIFLFFLFKIDIYSQSDFRVMFYNVENLFDCKHDSLKEDKEFLPESIRAWHYGRYKNKLTKIAKVISAVGEWTPPALVGLCEVENDNVMRDLVKNSPLKEYDYQYIITDSPDERGIDVALMWQRDRFRYLSHHSISVDYKTLSIRPTRDILHVTGLIHSGDSLDVFICHFPSRSQGEKESEPSRLLVASLIKQAVDSICNFRMSPNIIVMGDFNDYPNNKSLTTILEATTPGNNIEKCKLYNLMADKGKKTGTYNYRGEWGILDHILVSGHLLLNKAGLHTSNGDAYIASFPFLLKEDEKYGGFRPFRTYWGMKYEGGYSDHLPVYVDFKY